MSQQTKRGRAPKRRAFSRDDELDADALEAALAHLIARLKTYNLDTRLRDLRRADLETLTREAVIGWVLKRAEQVMAEGGDLSSPTMSAPAPSADAPSASRDTVSSAPCPGTSSTEIATPSS